MLYLKGYKWLLPQKQRARTDFLGYKLYIYGTKHWLSISKLFKEKQSERMSVPGL